MRRHALTVAALAAVAPLALAPLADAAAPHVGHAGHAARPAPLTLKALPASSSVGKTLTLRGNVAKGAKVLVQREYAGGHWTTVGKDTGDRHGHYAVKVKLTQGGTTSFRAVQGKTSTKPDSLAVYQWLWLDDQPQLVFNGGGVGVHLDVQLAKKTYHESYLAQGGAAVLVETDSLCTKGDASIGFDQFTTPDDGDTMTLQAGDADAGEPAVSKTAKPGKVAHADVPLKGADSAVFVFQVNEQSDGSSTEDAVLASPRLYCNASVLPQPQESSAAARSVARGWRS